MTGAAEMILNDQSLDKIGETLPTISEARLSLAATMRLGLVR